MSELSLIGGEPEPEVLAHPQPLFKQMRDAGPVIDLGGEVGMVIVCGDAEVRHVLQHPDVFSSGIDAVTIGQVRPLIPLQIDPPHHRNYRKLLDPIFAPRQIALLEDQTRELVRELVAAVVDQGGCNFHTAVAEPLPTTVFLQLLGLPVSRAQEFLRLKDGIIRPPVSTRGSGSSTPPRWARRSTRSCRRPSTTRRGTGRRLPRCSSTPRWTATASPTTTCSTSATCSSSPASTRSPPRSTA